MSKYPLGLYLFTLKHVPCRNRTRLLFFHCRNLGRSSRTTAKDVEHITQPEPDQLEHDLQEVLRRKRRTEWKRKQNGQSFLDHLVINVRGGRGGDGCAAFHREKFKPFGPPSGGNGGPGGSVYICASPHVTSLAGISKRVVAGPGTNGQGTWQHGRAGTDVTIYVPFGTIVREVTDSRRAKDLWEAEEESYRDLGLSLEERREKRRERRWLHYPQYEEANIGRDTFKEAEARVASEDRARRAEEIERRRNPLSIEFEAAVDESPEAKDAREKEEVSRPLGLPGAKTKEKGVLVAAGGTGGVGNPHFLSSTNRSPKFATRGLDGVRLTLELELKLVADVGLVGFPNAGKSTLLSALTKRRAEVAAYAFTTLNPQVGTVRVLEGGDFDGGGVVEESWLDREHAREGLGTGIEEGARKPRDGRGQEDEVFRFTIADNPGLIAKASENVGLGHSFLRSIERARALAYVVDLSGERPWDQLDILRNELESYKVGLSAKCRLVVANKADLLGGGSEESEEADEKATAKILEAKAKLTTLEAWIHNNLGPLDVVPVSAKYSQNLRRIVRLLSVYVDESRKANVVLALDDSSSQTAHPNSRIEDLRAGNRDRVSHNTHQGCSFLFEHWISRWKWTVWCAVAIRRVSRNTGGPPVRHQTVRGLTSLKFVQNHRLDNSKATSSAAL